jgi:hypothetical protein
MTFYFWKKHMCVEDVHGHQSDPAWNDNHHGRKVNA